MLPQQFRDLLAQTMLTTILTPLNCQILVDSVRPGSWAALPIGANFINAVQLLVDAADRQGWIRSLVQRLITEFKDRPELRTVLAEIDRPATVQTVADPFEEVLLGGDRPFVNRRGLRTQLLNLTDERGSTVMLVDGEPKTGKTYSYYLINHAAPSKHFKVNKFTMTDLPGPDGLAGQILSRLGVDKPLPPLGKESAERWAEKLADTVMLAIDKERVRRLFVFDEFPTARLPDGTMVDIPLPDGTVSFIVRLATYADQELRPWLRVVLMRFPGTLPQELDDVVLRDKTQPFTATDMVGTIMQIAQARNWSVTETAVRDKINDYYQTPEQSLNDRFKFLRGLLQQLATAPQ